MEDVKPQARLGEILTHCGMITAEQLDEALGVADRDGLRLGEALISLGILDKDRLTWALGVQFDLSYVDLQHDIVDWEFLHVLPLERLLELRLLPLARVGNLVTAVIADPTRTGIIDLLLELFPHEQVAVQLSSEDAIVEVLKEAIRRRTMAVLENDEHIPVPETARQLLELFDNGLTRRLAIIKFSGENNATAITENNALADRVPFSAFHLAQVIFQLQKVFARENLLPGGFMGFRSADGASPQIPLRVTAIQGPSAMVMALDTFVSPADEDYVASPVVAVYATDPDATIETLLAITPEGDDRMPLFLQRRIGTLSPNALQFEVVDTRLRIAAATRLHGAIAPLFTVVAGDTSRDLLTLPRLYVSPETGPIIVVLDMAAAGERIAPHYVKAEMLEAGDEAAHQRLLDSVIGG